MCKPTQGDSHVKAKASFPSDTISLKEFRPAATAPATVETASTRATSATSPSIEFNPYNKAEGADVHVNTGDKVYQKADWDAGGANAKAEKYSKAEGGKANSNGDQESDSGHDKSKVDANTTAYQTNYLAADKSQNVGAGIGGEGGDGNKAEGGDVDIKASIESANLNDVLNHSEYFHIDDLACSTSDRRL